MKKGLFAISLFAMGAIALSSCDIRSVSIDLKPEYENKVTKGNNVDSITLNVMDSQGTSKEVTISKNDKYVDMIQKLGRYTFNILNDNGKMHPYFESINRENTYEYNNYHAKKMVKNPDGGYQESDEFTSGDTKESFLVSANSTVYQQDSNNIFYIGNKVTYDKFDYNLASGNLSYGNKQDFLNKGTYIKLTGLFNNDEGSIEYASNRELNNQYCFGGFNSTTKSLMDDFDSIYYQASWADYNSYKNVSRLKAESYDIYFNTDNLINGRIQTQVSDCAPFNYYGSSVVDIFSGNFNYIPESLQRYYEYSFELTDKYIIVKNKINLSEVAMNFIAEGGLNESDTSKILKQYEGSYTYKEVWIDYNNYKEQISNSANNAYLCYAYSKTDCLEIRTNTGTWDLNERYYDIDSDTLQSLGLIGKTWTVKEKSEYHYESYVIDIDENVINNKKTEFINECKKNNFLDKYKFTKVANQ